MTDEILHIGERGYVARTADLENAFKDTLSLFIITIIKI